MQSLHLFATERAMKDGQSTKFSDRRFTEHRTDRIASAHGEVGTSDFRVRMLFGIQSKNSTTVIERIIPRSPPFGPS